jgi:LacI family transcriptional regulator
MKRDKRPTIKQIAKAAGVSTQTVSRVLNDRPDVAADTLQRVRQIIKETGYAPNALARGLIQGRSHTLGVVAYGLDYFGPSRVLTGIEQKAAEMGYSIFLNLLHRPATSDVDNLLNNLIARQVDGIIWAIPEIGDNRAWSRARSPHLHVPTVLVNGMAGPTSLPLVAVDNLAIGRLATQHLLDGGAQHIGIVTGPPDWWEAEQRLLGWRAALAAHGLAAEERLVAAGDWTAKSGEQGLYQLLAQYPTIDAVFAGNDQMALGVLRAAHRLGRRIPDDLSVVGVDNTPESAHFWPSLTTVRQRLRASGALAVEEIVHLIQNSKTTRRERDGAEAKTTLLQPELILRESSRPIAPASSPSPTPAHD